MDIELIRLEIIKTCFRPGNSPAVNVSDFKVFEEYVLDKRGTVVPDVTKKTVPKK